MPSGRPWNEKVLVITGGPGTGKTTIINGIIRIASKTGQKVLCAAPTGRAAKRMTEATGVESRTIHRLLEYNPRRPISGTGFKRNESNPVEAGLVIIDEASMIDAPLMYHLLKAIPAPATLVPCGRYRPASIGRARKCSEGHYRFRVRAHCALNRHIPAVTAKHDHRQCAPDQQGPNARVRERPRFRLYRRG